MKGAGRRVVWMLPALFFLLFAGGGALQGFMKTALPEEWAPELRALRATWLLAALYFSFMIWRILVPASQRFLGDRVSLVLAAVTYSLMPCALLVTTNFTVLVVLAVAWGFGAASLWQTAPVWLYDVTPSHRRGLWAGIIYLATYAGLIAGAKMLSAASDISGRSGLLTVAIVPTGVGLFLAFALPGRRSPSKPLSLSGLRLTLGSRRVMLVGVLLFSAAMAYGLLLGVFRDEIESTLGTQALGNILAIYFAVRLAVAVLGGAASDFLGRRIVTALAFVATGAVLLVAAPHRTGSSMAFAGACLGLVSGVIPISATALAADWFEPSMRSQALGAAFVWRDAGMVISLLGGQYLARWAGGFHAVIGVFGGVFVLCGALSMFLPGQSGRSEDAS